MGHHRVVRHHDPVVHVRDSKDLAQPPLGFTPAAWSDFLPYASGG
ncbi:DUF397 domain-containing protein [Streptomyces sp. TRM75563]|nr:DUF397 domain-containing protein [Streptomyces sp. TRM75563]MCI4045403.1 DUF397 domain-containing protein [Streptomyces sp. TRM75563]